MKMFQIQKKVEEILKFVIKKFKKIDVIINNAGISYFTKFENRTNYELNSTLNTNLVGTINVCRNYLKLHKVHKLKKCKIINIGSIYGLLSPDFNIYDKGDNINLKYTVLLKQQLFNLRSTSQYMELNII